MEDPERVRRPVPARTEPVRNASGVFRDGGDAPLPRTAGHSHPFDWPSDDPVGHAVRAGCDVVESAVRRGFGVGRDPVSPPPWSGGPLAGPRHGPWSTGQWIDAMTGVVTQWSQWMDVWSSAARSALSSHGGGSAEPWPASWSSAPPPLASPSPSPSPSGAAAAAAAVGGLRVALELRTARAITVEVDLSPVGATGYEVHGLLAPAALAAPPITEVSLAIADGVVTVAIGSLEHHPAGRYAGAVLAAGRACGTLTVHLV